MQATVTLPTADITASNFASFDIGKFTFWFSYRTLIGFYSADSGLIVRDNAWGTTTGKHLNNIDGGLKEAKAKRLSGDDFLKAYSQHVASYVD